MVQGPPQFRVWVSNGSGVIAECTNGVNELRWQLRYWPVELHGECVTLLAAKVELML
jgi:hypothetical protein